ncbi:hypothetical protein H4219_003256 [Mycoemilia scoparia]|uniref:G-protein coupled receptors family 2 profile 2 domain-containing protein n=1 Tax=Mycoemilia scoparia TaxID=417184 RepID=A0A9W7ZW32_9FUNG|nr:hypothetical protein H4219_003256 [Mycoemilia scoparia]
MTRNLTTWVSFTVALNLQLVMCHNIRDTRKFEPFYYAVSAVIALVPFIVTISVNSQPDVVISDYCLDDAVYDPESYALYWPRGIVYTLAGIAASLVSISYILVHIFRTRMIVIQNERESLDLLEAAKELKQKEIIDKVNKDVAIQAPKTALIPPPRWHAQTFDRTPLTKLYVTN